MTIPEQVQARYEAYLKEAEALEAAAKPWDGLLGFGARPADHPCHTQFLDALVQILREAGGSLTPEEALAVANLVVEAPRQHTSPVSIYWTLVAAHGALLPVIPQLKIADRAELLSRYQAAYPRRTRLPVQKQVIRALEKTAG